MAFRLALTQTLQVGKRNRNLLLLTLRNQKILDFQGSRKGLCCGACPIPEPEEAPFPRCNISSTRAHAGLSGRGPARSPRHSGDTSEAMSSEYGTKVFIGDVATKVCHTQTPRAHGAVGSSREHPLQTCPPPAVRQLAHLPCIFMLGAADGARRLANVRSSSPSMASLVTCSRILRGPRTLPRPKRVRTYTARRHVPPCLRRMPRCEAC